MATEYPKNLLDFEQWFRSESACRNYLARLRWREGFRCPRCGSRQSWLTARGLYHCGGCQADTSPLAGTIFHRTHIPLRLWFRAMWWITNQKSGVSALGLQRLLGLGSYRTAWTCLHKLRRAMVRSGREQLYGKIEVDETLVGGVSRGGRGHEEKVLVGIAAEIRGQATGRIRLAPLKDASAESLVAFVQKAITPGSVVITDGRSGYRPLKEAGYAHEPVTLDGKGRQAAGLVLPRVHRVASLLKRWLLGIHQGGVSKSQMAAYLDEFGFRYNRRLSTDRGMLFYRLAQQAVQTSPVPYESIKSR